MISDDMGLTPDDVISALDALGALIRDPITGAYAFKLKPEFYAEVIRQHEAKDYARLNPKGLVWTPYIMGRGNASIFEHAPPPLHTVAPREEDEEAMRNQSLSSTSKRDFDSFNSDNNGDIKEIPESLGKMTTKTGELIRINGAASSLGQSSSSQKANGISKLSSYFDTANSIPATRFQIYPPVPGSRNRTIPRVLAAKPSPRPRPSLSASRPKSRRPSGTSSARRASTARPRSSTSRRKTGGTGRGPGRWPKGTKKSDFGNADSGPGLPPRLLKQRSKLGNEVLLGDEAGEDEEKSLSQEDDIYETPAPKSRSQRSSTRGIGLGKPILGKGKGLGLGKGKGKGKTILVDGDGDRVMADALGEEDAEGEEE